MKTYYVFILDKSGSMAEVRDRTVTDYNEKVQICQTAAKEGGQEIFVCLVSFNEHLDEHLWLQPSIELKEATTHDYNPNGGTALNDAIGYVLTKLDETVQLTDDDAFFVTVITDGEENSSIQYRGKAGEFRIKQMIQEHESRLHPSNKKSFWTITYIGANQRVEDVADRLGIQLANCAVYSTRNASTVGAAYSHYNQRLERCLRARSTGQSATANFLSDEDGKVADYTNLTEEK